MPKTAKLRSIPEYLTESQFTLDTCIAKLEVAALTLRKVAKKLKDAQKVVATEPPK